MKSEETQQIETAVATILARENITLSSVFVPFSKSRCAKEKSSSLNWKVTIKRGTRSSKPVDYMAGSGHCPAYIASMKLLGGQNCVMRDAEIRKECETGKAWPHFNGAPLLPDTANVLYCLLLDASVLDASSFEEWARECGYDTDSRSAEKMYRECLATALDLRALLGDAVMTELRDAMENY